MTQHAAHMPSGLVIAASDLAGLQWLSTLATEADYLAQSDGPYKVGDIADKAAFVHPLQIAHTLSTLSDEDAANIERARNKLRSDFPDEGHRDIIAGILAIDDALGFKRNVVAIAFDQRLAAPGKTQRSGVGWHYDAGGATGYERRNGSRFTRRYTVSSTAGTVFLREQASRTPSAWSRGRAVVNAGNITAHEPEARAKNYMVESEPYAIYLMPPRTLHRGQVMPTGGERTFLRICCFG